MDVDEEDTTQDETAPLFTPETTQTLLRRVMTRAYDNRIEEMQQREDDELQRAIMASLEESNKQQEDKADSVQGDSDDNSDDNSNRCYSNSIKNFSLPYPLFLNPKDNHHSTLKDQSYQV